MVVMNGGQYLARSCFQPYRGYVLLLTRSWGRGSSQLSFLGLKEQRSSYATSTEPETSGKDAKSTHVGVRPLTNAAKAIRSQRRAWSIYSNNPESILVSFYQTFKFARSLSVKVRSNKVRVAESLYLVRSTSRRVSEIVLLSSSQRLLSLVFSKEPTIMSFLEF